MILERREAMFTLSFYPENIDLTFDQPKTLVIYGFVDQVGNIESLHFCKANIFCR